MKKLTRQEFKKILSRSDWQFHQDEEIVGKDERFQKYWDEELSSYQTESLSPKVWGWASKVARLDELEIIFTEEFSYIERDAGSFKTFVDPDFCEPWVFSGFCLWDEALDTEIHLSDIDVDALMPKEFKTIDYDFVEEVDQK